MRLFYFLLLFLISSTFYSGKPLKNNYKKTNTKVVLQNNWVEQTYAQMTLSEKIGQLFMVQVFSNQNNKEKAAILELIKNQKVGGVIYSNGGPYRQVRLNNELQAASKIPLLVGMDAEWGLSMRLDSTFAFPWNMTLGAVKNKQLIERVGKHIGEHCKRLGVHINFAPVVDINTNPNNPIIGNRSFGENKNNVTEKALAFMQGMQGAGVLACAKHFPGHGDTENDSHKTLPTINFTEERIDSVELYPYKALINNGLESVMVAHLNVPSMELQQHKPSSLSKYIVTDVLKNRLAFKGLIFTDALTMKGVANYRDKGVDNNKAHAIQTGGESDLAAFLAGNDVLLMSEDVKNGIAKIKDAYTKGIVTEARLSHSVKKILAAKYKVGVHQYKPINSQNLYKDLNRRKDSILYEEVMEEAITIVKNENNEVPLRNLETKKIAYVKFGDDSGSDFLETLQKYSEVQEVKAKELSYLLEELKTYNTVIIGLHKSNVNPWKAYKFSDKEKIWLQEIAKANTVVLTVFSKPYALLNLPLSAVNSVIVSYQNSTIAQEKSAEIIFGAIAAKGTIPVSINETIAAGKGIYTSAIGRLGYTYPERVGVNAKTLHKIDSIVTTDIKNKVTPGAQVLVARKGKVIYAKNFGKHTYSTSAENVKFKDVYDVASLTKILATLPVVMELEEQGILSLDSKLSELLPAYKNSNKASITIKQMLSHYARLKPWIPFYYATLDSLKHPNPKYYSKNYTSHFNLKVANNLYMRNDYQDTIQKIIRDSDLLSRLRYRYSDLPYYILKKYIETHYNTPLNEIVQTHFYQSLGANYTMYNPSNKLSYNNIVPTEEDDYFRYQKIQGYVHDMGAAMQGGIGGHAGIFSNANDVAKIMQMYIQDGIYGGRQYLSAATIKKFNTCYFCDNYNRRGVGFDKPQLGEKGPTCGCVSMNSFGHSGFTGAYTWADPDEEIVYVYLSNRTYPTSKGKNKLVRAGTRSKIQRIIYDALHN